MSRRGASLADRYERLAGRVHLTGIQALARLPIDQSRRDARSGQRIGAFVSGYEGSPLAGYDLELQRQARLLDKHAITFQPGLNEELAATAVQGSQLISGLDATVDGVVGYWYGKAPGLDRASDALRHANLMGTAPSGGAVALVGDDPAAKSSSVPGASEHALADLGIPTFYPADAGEILELGRHAVALSRASGLWSALKIVTAVADGSVAVDLSGMEPDVVVPDGSHRHQPSARLLQPVLGALERDQVTNRLPIAVEYAARNGVNRVVGPATARVGIVSAGKTHLDVLEALAAGGVDPHAVDSPVRVLKLGMVWPIEPGIVRDFARGLDEIVVVEEKRSFLEAQVRDVLYDVPRRPAVSGKWDPDGTPLVPAYGELDAGAVGAALGRRLAAHGLRPAVTGGPDAVRPAPRRLLPMAERTPYFCSGCPHSTSTRPHVDSPVGAGIGCHAMVLLMDPQQVGEVVGLTQMGGEGAQWLGMAPFVKPRHFVQNLGDGTFYHSGSLAVRAAVAAGANVTFRLLYNGTVAMTGGQDPVGGLSVAALVENLRSEGVARVVVTTDDVRALRRAGLPRATTVRPRSEIGAVERSLAAVPGVTVLIHVQDCATELRRKRKRGTAPDPQVAVVINERLCEGCGDCGAKSTCLSVEPVDTEFGRKTAINQTSCNTDLSCLAGDCPAFMTVRPGDRVHAGGRPPELAASDLPAPTPAEHRTLTQVRLVGIGGTGVVSTSQILATAAFLDGRHVRTLDQTGLAQKGGTVVSDLKIADAPIAAGNKVGDGECDLYLAYDVLGASEPRHVGVLSPSGTAVVSTSFAPTGAMVSNRAVDVPRVPDLVASIAERIRSGGRVVEVDVRAYVTALFGDEQVGTTFLLGVAFQTGELPVSADALEEAVRLNGVAVGLNLQAFRRGRQLVADRAALESVVAAVGPQPPATVTRPLAIVQADDGSELGRLAALRAQELTAYQNEALALRYERLVERARSAASALPSGSTALAEAVARHYFTLLAYKDEYEVARLALDPSTRAAVTAQFGPGARTSWHLHPPALRALGLRRKLVLGPWFGLVFRGLYACRGLRGSWLDPFGHAQVRRVERELLRDYEDRLSECLDDLTVETLELVAELAALPSVVRGYEEVKLRSVEEYRRRQIAVLGKLDQRPSVASEVTVPPR